MNNFKIKRLIPLAAFLMFAFSCKPKQRLPDLPFLKKNEVSRLRVGDKFIISTAENSCCTYGWMVNDSLQLPSPVSKLFESEQTITSPADKDCDGCSTYYYHVYKCTSTGTDTLTYAAIPNGGRSKGWAGMEISTYIIKVEN